MVEGTDGKCHMYQPNSQIPLCGTDLKHPEFKNVITFGDDYETGLGHHKGRKYCSCGNKPCEECDEAAEKILAKRKGLVTRSG